jgi:hypothetical protein
MNVKRLTLGWLLALAVVAGARAEDAVVPYEWENNQAVGACDHLGSGFAKLPGTDICARVSGKVSYEKHFQNRSTASGGKVQLDFETRSD